MLVHSNFSCRFILDTDASDTGNGAVLSQIDDNRMERVVRDKLLAVVFFTRQFRPYLVGHHFTLHTDHGLLTYIVAVQLQGARKPACTLA